VDVIEPVDETCFNPKDIRWQTMRASGPGGQHVNETESAVRVIHLPTDTEATAMEERSQHRNRTRLMQKLNLFGCKTIR
jgi:protein subunit release factor A